MSRSGLTVFAAASCCIIMTGCRQGKEDRVTPELLARGRNLFAVLCAGCHPGGENRLYPTKTLHRMDLKANGITKAADIVAIMRNPGQGMRRFDRKTVGDLDAYAIAQFVLDTF